MSASKSSLIKVLAIVASLLSASTGVYAAVLDFDQPGTATGTIAFDGTNVFGVDIEFNAIVGDDTPFNDGESLNCAGCLLDFTTGNLTSTTPIPGGAIYAFGAGGSFTIDTGTIGVLITPAGQPDFSPAFVASALDPILSGTWSFSTMTVVNQTVIFGGEGQDTKATPLVEFFLGAGANGPPPLNFTQTSTEISTASADVQLDGTFSAANVSEADLINAVPEPGTSVLLLLGLTGIAIRRRTR